jgi:hypothetical protein
MGWVAVEVPDWKCLVTVPRKWKMAQRKRWLALALALEGLKMVELVQ